MSSIVRYFSTPCAPDALTAIEQTVICPDDPGVYSKDHREKTHARLRERHDAIEKAIAEKTGELREMEADLDKDAKKKLPF